MPSAKAGIARKRVSNIKAMPLVHQDNLNIAPPLVMIFGNHGKKLKGKLKKIKKIMHFQTLKFSGAGHLKINAYFYEN
jgi:hypothetical protein